jgi:Tol biopolymer transport system component
MTIREKFDFCLALRIRMICCVVCCCAFAYSVDAQFYSGHNLTFGKSRIQYEKRLWSYYRTAVADIYYYPQSKDLAVLTSEHVQKTVTELERKLGITLERKLQIIIYARQSDFMQSNIGLETEDIYNTGGITPIYGDKIFLYFKGNLNAFLDDLRGGIAGLFVNYFIVGGTMGSNISASYASSFPVWFTDGLSAYFSQEWTSDLDNMAKDGITNKRYRKIHYLSQKEQQVAGFAFWRFVVKKYGETALPIILHYASSTHNYERAIQYALQSPFENILAEWINYYSDIYTPKSEEEDPLQTPLIKYRKNTNYLYPKISPDGEHLAYVSNLDGRIKIWILNLQNHKRKCIYRSNYRIDNNPDYSYPLLAWHPSANFLMVMKEYHDKVYLHPFLLDKKKWDKKQVVFVSKILDFSYSSDGRFIALSGAKDGQSDIYLYNVASRSLEQITRDKADDFSPRFIRNNSQLIFSSNRQNDTIDADKDKYQEGKYDLFIYNIAGKEDSKLLTRVTFTPNANETYAMDADKDYISFLSDGNGVQNRYLGEFKNVISYIDTAIHHTSRVQCYPVSNYSTGIHFQDINTDNAEAAQQIFRKGRWVIGTEHYSRFSDLRRQELTSADYLSPLANDSLSNADTVKKNTQPQKRLRQSRLSDINIASSDTAATENEKQLVVPTIPEQETLIPRNYEVQYFINTMTAQIDFSYLNTTYQQFVKAQQPIYLNPGLNAFLMVSIRDLMEDYRMIGGVRISIDLNNLEFLYSYENLKHRLDKQIAIHYQSIKSFDGRYNIRQQNINLHYILKYPFDRVNSLHTAFTIQYNRYDLRAIDDYSLEQQPEHKFWLGTKAEYIIDNTRTVNINMLNGFRGKLFAEFFFTPDSHFNNMLVLGLDMRHYARLHRTLIWANRFAASTSAGKNRLIYYMGGVDNWIFPKFNQEISIDTSVNYSYQTLATNMRGFTQNIRNGTSFFVINSELRFQIVQCFSKKPLRSEFLRSLQFILFGDIGTAWAGLHPYLEDNALFTRTIQSGDITVTVKHQLEPVVGGFGLGLRFQLLSYFIRLDYAWGVENYRVSNKGVLYLSFNLDF